MDENSRQDLIMEEEESAGSMLKDVAYLEMRAHGSMQIQL